MRRHSIGRSHISKFWGWILLDRRCNALFQIDVTASSPPREPNLQATNKHQHTELSTAVDNGEITLSVWLRQIDMRNAPAARMKTARHTMQADPYQAVEMGARGKIPGAEKWCDLAGPGERRNVRKIDAKMAILRAPGKRSESNPKTAP